ncbi:prohibitin family protein [Gloeothece verrucosa]|uniref:Band 7 protein n=1 Tax=Gloeothece verrucosa (strain PCC 7822) TaxID=497965 RepID=E0UDV3_GLOV7|nr:prohibitin family protein [Gloeothece verrucosa]ADN16538.1 band 7 protein [Gloeothece verrucosa PCC 7822]
MRPHAIVRNPIWFIITGGAIGIMALIILGFQLFVIINPGQKGLVITLGKLEDSVLNEGTYFVFPLTTQVKKFDTRIQKTEIESNGRTKELQQINTKTVLNWRVEPAKLKEIYQQIGTEEQVVNKIITPIFDETVKATIPSKTLEQILAKREELQVDIFAKIKKRLAPYGIVVDNISFVNLTASEEFTKATEERQIAEQRSITAKKEAEALISKAEGEAKAQKLLQQTLTPALLQKMAIDKWNGQYPTVMGNSNALPLININPTSPQAATP